MPTYTYRCNNCDYEFDIRQRMADEPLTDCPSCETEKGLRKVLNSVGIVFKGSGFYVTDNRGNGSTAVSSPNGSSENGESPKPSADAKENSSKTEAKKADPAPKKSKKEKTSG